MGKYGDAAVRAVKLVSSGDIKSPKDAWYKATIEIFGEGKSSQRKGCPRAAFLGLCEEGLIKGIRPDEYTKSKENKEYAIKAVQILRKIPKLSSDQEALWNRVIGSEYKVHNQQMDVVTSLWNNNLIIDTKIEELENKGKEIKPLVFKEPTKGEVATARGFDYLGGQVRFKVSVKNYTALMIFNIIVNMDIPSEFQLVKISPKPSIQDLKTGMARIDRLAPDESRGIDFYLEPLTCGKGVISGIVNYRDAKGKWKSIPIEPKDVSIKCPLVFTPEDANIAMIENLYNKLPNDFRRFFLPFDAKLAAQYLHDTIRRFDVRHIRTVEISTKPYEVESWFYTRAKMTNHQIAIISKVSDAQKVIDIWIACEDASELTGLLAKISEDFQDRVLKESKVQLKYTFGKLKKLKYEECGAALPKLPTPTEVVECEFCKTVWTYQTL